MKKRLLAFLLVLIMVIGMLPTSVFAASLPSGWTTTKPSGSYVTVYGTTTTYGSESQAIKSGPLYGSKWYYQVSSTANTSNQSYTIPQVSTLFELNDGWTLDHVTVTANSGGDRQPGSSILLASSGATLVYYFKQTTPATPTTYDHVLKYNLNGGTSTYTFPEQRQDGTAATSHEFTIYSQTPTHATNSLKSFLGWADSASATAAQYQPGGQITVSGTKTIYAVWSDCQHADTNDDGFCDGCNKCMHTKSSGSNCSIPDCDHGESCTCGGQPSELPPTGGDSAPSWNPDLMLPDENMSFGFDIACSVNSAHDLFVDKSSAGCTTNAGFFGECCTVNTTAKQNASTGKYYFEITLNAPDNYYPDGHTADTSKTNTPIKLYVKQTQGGTYTLDTWTNGIYYVKCEQVPETKYAVNYHFLDADGKEIDKKTEYFTEGKHAEYTLLSGKKDGFTFDGWYEKAADIGTASKKLTSLKTSKKYELYGKYTAETMNVYVYFQTVDTAGKTIVLNAAELTANGLKYNSSAKDWMTLGSFTTTESTLEKLEAEANSSKFVHHADNAPITPSMIECFQLKTLTTSYGFPDGKAYHLDGKLPFAKITFVSGAEESETVTGMPTSGYYYKGKTISATPTREGYDFLGWENVNESNGGGYVQTVTVGASDAKYTAVWQKREITLKYDANGGEPTPEPQVIPAGSTAVRPEDPTYSGYRFDGWFLGDSETAFDFDTPVTANITLTAKWTKLYPVKLVIYRNGDFEKAYKTIDLDSLPKGETYDVSALDIADYYTANATGKYDFHGFYNDGLWNEYKANPEKERAGLTSIKINGWTNLKCMVYDYEKVCLFKSYDDVIEDKAFAEYEALHGANVVDFLNDLGLELDQEGHTHDEWYKKDSPKWKFSDKDTFNGWTNVLIKYTVNEYNVTFKLNGGNVDGDTADIVVPVKWNTTVTAPENVVRQTGVKGTKYYYDYKLVGWLDADGNEFAFTTPVKDNLTLTAYWQPPTKMSSIGMVRTSAFIARCTTDEDHPTFAVPSLNSPSAKTATLACVDGTWTVVMSFNAATTISTHCKSEIKTNWGGIKHTYAGNNTEYLRMAWDETAEEWYPVALSEYNKKTKDYDDIKVLEDNIFYLDCTCVTKPADPTATDIAKIILAGRDTTNKDSLVKYKNGTKFKNVTLIDGTYTVGEVTGNRADGFHVTVTLTNLQPYADALNANRTDLTATAGEFVLDTDRNTLPMVLGLKIDGGKTDLGSAKWEVDKTGYTKTEELNGKNFYLTHEYTVTFDADGGTPEPDAQKVVWGKTATEPTAPEKTNYDFLGWFEADSETAFDFSTPITASVTLTAHWKLKIYTVKYHGNGGYLTANPEKNTTTSTGTIGQELTLKNDETFTREHYNFLGWATTETATEAEYEGSQVLPTGFDVEPGSTVDLYAVWQIKTYTICSDLRVNGNEAWQAGKTYAWTYRYGDEYGKTIDYTDMFAALKAEALNADAANSPNADKVDIVLCFPGSSNIFNEAVTTYGQDTATWNPSNDTAYIWGYATMYYDVTFDTNGGTTEAAQLVKFNELVTEPTTAPTKEGNWRFKGWYTDADCTTLYDFTTPVTKSMTLYAGYDKTTSQLDPIVYYYEVHHIKQLADTIYDDDDNVDADYDLEEIEIEHLYAEAGTNATATAKDYGEHFHVNNGLSTFSAPVIKPELDNDGNVVFLILEIYYDRDTHTLTYDPNGGSLNGQQATYTVRCGSVIMDGPLLAPTRAGYRFTGWYADADCNTLFDFDAGITADTTVYAGWVSDTPTVQTFRLTINYVFRNGTTAADSVSLDLVAGTPYEVKSPTVRGYYPNRRVVKGTMPEENITLTVTYYRACYMIPTVTKVSPRLNTSEHFAYVQGYPDGTVRPQNSITRAETAAILFRLMDEATRKAYYSTNSGFKDVTTTNWYNTYVATLNNAGIITDSAKGYFRPNDAITRAELAAMLAQFADKKNAKCYFTDVYANYWAANAIATCASLGWITGYPDGSFRPDNSVTRAELMAMINRALGRTPHAASDLLAGMNKWSDNANTSVWYYLHVQEATNSHTFAYAGTYEYWTGLTTDPDWSKYE